MGEEFAVELAWVGRRDSVGRAAGHADIPQSSAGGYAGDPTRWNPEELLGLSLAQCHFLTFLALLEKAKIHLLAYSDRITVTLDKADGLTRVTKIRLAPDVAVAPGTDLQTAVTLFHKAHKYCFIANSITPAVELYPSVHEAG